jgi:hypothetical protein
VFELLAGKRKKLKNHSDGKVDIEASLTTIIRAIFYFLTCHIFYANVSLYLILPNSLIL